MTIRDTISRKGGGRMDSRMALAANTQLYFQNKEGGAVRYTILREIGRGGSCIVYEASYETNTGDVKYVRVKECYPLRLRIERMDNGCLRASADDKVRFDAAQKKFESDFRLGNGLFYADGLYDALTTTLDIYSGNETTYLVSAFSPEKTLAACHPKSLHECLTLIKQIARILKRIHDEGYLYLDIKPDNVLILDTYTTRVQLFDLDSLVPVGNRTAYSSADPGPIKLSFSRGFAAIELQTGQCRKWGRYTDVYGVGSLLFYLLFDSAPTAADCEPNAVYDFTKSRYAGEQYSDPLFFILTEFFHNALANFYLDRYPDMEPVIEALNHLESLADPAKPYIVSSVVAAPPVTMGRQKELQILSEWLGASASPCIFVTGMGGIGKSTLVRAFLSSQREHFDNVLYLPFTGSLIRTLTDDRTACIHTVEKFREETPEEYYHRKLRAFRKIVHGTTSILVIDNYSGEISRELSDVLAVGWKVILISRKQPAGNTYPVISVRALTEQADLYNLFEYNLGARLQPDDCPDLDNIIRRIDGHTLVLELIAKQIASSYLTIQEASELTASQGFTAIAPEKVICQKDTDACPETLRSIITSLFEADHLSLQKKNLLKVMSLTGNSGIDIRLLHTALALESKNDANVLIRDGWMILSGKIISLHPVIRETIHCWEWSAKAKSYAVRLMSYLCRGLRADLYNSVLVQLSEEILGSCRREPVLLEETIYTELLYRTVIQMPRYREDFILERANELIHNPRILSGSSIMKLYDCILSVYQERKEFGTASAALKEAEQAAKKFRNNYVWALYYDLLSHFCDHVLNGAYDAVRPDEKHLIKRMMDAINKAIHYARKSHAPGSKPLLAKNLLARAAILIRSEPK